MTTALSPWVDPGLRLLYRRRAEFFPGSNAPEDLLVPAFHRLPALDQARQKKSRLDGRVILQLHRP